MKWNVVFLPPNGPFTHRSFDNFLLAACTGLLFTKAGIFKAATIHPHTLRCDVYRSTDIGKL